MISYWFVILISTVFVLSCFNCPNLFESFTPHIVKNKNNNKLIQSNKKHNNQIDMLTYSDFKPECCPSIYTNSSGCLCYNNIEDLALITRGGNRYFTHNDAYIQSITKNKRNKYVNPNLQ